MPGRDGTGPLGMGPCGRNGCECRRKISGKSGHPADVAMASADQASAGDRNPDKA